MSFRTHHAKVVSYGSLGIVIVPLVVPKGDAISAAKGQLLHAGGRGKPWWGDSAVNPKEPDSEEQFS